MGLFDRYMFIGYLKVFSLVSFASLCLIALYGLTDFLLGFKEKELAVAIAYMANLVPVGFYVLSSLLVGLSLLVFMRRVLSKKKDFIAYSFGISPLRFLMPLLTVVLVLCFSLLFLNESFLPNLFKRIWYIEKTFKKKQEVGRIVERLWFVKSVGGRRYYVYVGSLEVDTGRFSNFLLLITSSETRVEEIIEGKRGRWVRSSIRIEEGLAYDFSKAVLTRELRNFSLETEINLSEVSLFAEKIAHVSSSSLINLFLKGEKFGFEVDRYMAEVLYRVGMSFLPLVVFIPVSMYTLRFRSVRTGAFAFIFSLIGGWMVAVSPKLFVDKAGLPVLYSVPLHALLVLYLLKGVHYLSKGFRL